MSRRIIFHIGPAKTGTSSLQDSLYAAQDHLMAQGVAYPTLGRYDRMPKLPGHHGLPAALQAGLALPVPLMEWIGDLPRDHVVVFSSEDFSNLAVEQVAALAAQIPGAEVEVVYYARRWDRLMPSVWQELVKHGSSRSYPEFLNQQTAAPRASFYLNYAMVLDRWAQVFGTGSIRLWSFDNAIEETGDIVAHFCRRVLEVTPPPPQAQERNSSWPASSTEILRLLNRLSFGTGAGTPSVRQRLWQALPLLAAEMAELEAELAPFLRRCRPCAPLVLHALEHELLQRYGGQLGNPTAAGGLFPLGDFAEAGYYDSDHLLISRSAALIRDLHQKLELPLAE
jgi:hypothetical protein